METSKPEKPLYLLRQRPPAVPGLPVLGNSLNMLYDPLKFLVDQYHQYGSTFRIQMAFRDYTIMAGLEANKFLAQEGEQVFSSKSLFGGMADAFNTDVMLVLLDGAPHRHMRKLMRRGFARSAALPHLDTMVQIVREAVAEWQPGEMLPIFNTLRRIVVDQLGVMSTGFRPGEYYDDIFVYLNTMLNVTAVKVWPGVMLHTPRFRRAKGRVIEFGRKLLDYHRQNPPESTGREPNLIDDILAGVRPDDQPFTEDDLLAMAVGPFFAGMDTVASTISFFMYTLHKHPDVLEQVMAEVNAVFAKGSITPQDFQQMPVLHAAAIETLRYYPATPFTPRQVVESFEFGGYEFPIGIEVMIAQTVTHFLPEYYPDPYKFDVTRHLGETAKSRIPNVYAPFSLGAHTCLGAGLAEVQMLVTMASLLYYGQFALESPDYEVRVHTMPLPNPGSKFKMRFGGQRHS